MESFNGQVYVKIRDYFQRKDKELWSTPQGINLNIHEWDTLVSKHACNQRCSKRRRGVYYYLNNTDFCLFVCFVCGSACVRVFGGNISCAYYNFMINNLIILFILIT